MVQKILILYVLLTHLGTVGTVNIQTCDVVSELGKKFVYVDSSPFGLDILTLKRKHLIFKDEYTSCEYAEHYYIPDHVTPFSIQTSTTSVSSVVITKRDEVRKNTEMDFSLGASGLLRGIPIAGAYEFKSTREWQFATESKSCMVKTASRVELIGLMRKETSPLDSLFKADLERVFREKKREKQEALLCDITNLYGGAFLKYSTLGGMYKEVTYVRKDYVLTSDKVDISHSASLKVPKFFDVGFSHKEENEKLENFEANSIRKDIETVGGDVGVALTSLNATSVDISFKKLQAWMSTVKNKPVPIGGEIVPLYDLLTIQRFPQWPQKFLNNISTIWKGVIERQLQAHVVSGCTNINNINFDPCANVDANCSDKVLSGRMYGGFYLQPLSKGLNGVKNVVTQALSCLYSYQSNCIYVTLRKNIFKFCLCFKDYSTYYKEKPFLLFGGIITTNEMESCPDDFKSIQLNLTWTDNPFSRRNPLLSPTNRQLLPFVIPLFSETPIPLFRVCQAEFSPSHIRNSIPINEMTVCDESEQNESIKAIEYEGECLFFLKIRADTKVKECPKLRLHCAYPSFANCAQLQFFMLLVSVIFSTVII